MFVCGYSKNTADKHKVTNTNTNKKKKKKKKKKMQEKYKSNITNTSIQVSKFYKQGSNYKIVLNLRLINDMYHGDPTVNIGIKHDFPFINIR